MRDLTHARNYVRRALEEIDALYPKEFDALPDNLAADRAKYHLETALHWMTGSPQRLEEDS